METSKKPQYIRVKAEAYKSLFEQYQPTLKKMGINSLSKLVRWCANEGKPIVEKNLKELC